MPVSLLFHDVFACDPAESGFCSPAANRYKLSSREFEAQLRGVGAIGKVRLTFDDGGVSYYTLIADALEALGVRGYCFVTTDFVGGQRFLTPAQIRELDARGHVIGTHSASHPLRFSSLSPAQMRREWLQSRLALEDLLGHAVTTGSVPGGYFSRAVAHSAADAGLQLLFNSEPVTSTSAVDGCSIAGRYAIRRGAAPDFSARLTCEAPWRRWVEWASWNAKGVVKPLCGASYPRIADWIKSRVPDARIRA